MPKKKFKVGGLLATLVISGLAAVGLRSYEVMKTSQVLMQSAESSQEVVPMLAKTAVSAAPSFGSIALWFLGGALFSLALYLILINIVRRSN